MYLFHFSFTAYRARVCTSSFKFKKKKSQRSWWETTRVCHQRRYCSTARVSRLLRTFSLTDLTEAMLVSMVGFYSHYVTIRFNYFNNNLNKNVMVQPQQCYSFNNMSTFTSNRITLFSCMFIEVIFVHLILAFDKHLNLRNIFRPLRYCYRSLISLFLKTITCFTEICLLLNKT